MGFIYIYILFFTFFVARAIPHTKTSVLCENSKFQDMTCSIQINVNFLILDSINIDYNNEILII